MLLLLLLLRLLLLPPPPPPVVDHGLGFGDPRTDRVLEEEGNDAISFELKISMTEVQRIWYK